MTKTLFTHVDPGLGAFTLAPLDPLSDAETVHAWVTHPKAAFWLMGDAALQDVERAYMAVAADQHQDAFLGFHGGEPAFLVERYDPAHRELVGLCPAAGGDIGMHFLTAPTNTPLPGFTRAVIRTVMEFLFADPAVRRVVVEPDVRNGAVHRLNETVGFIAAGRIEKPEKTALLSFCTRERFTAVTRAAPHNS